MLLALNRRLKVGYLVLAALILVPALTALGSIALTTDELLEYQGVVDHLRFAQLVFKGEKPDLHEAIVYNLENYGIVAKLPAYLVSRFAGIHAPVDYGQLAMDATPYGLYFQLSHLSAILLGLAGSALLIIAARLIGIRLFWVPGLILLLTPRFSGDSIFNIKDVPFACFYLLYSLSLLLRLRRTFSHPGPVPASQLLLSALAAGLMGSMKIVALLPVLISEVVLVLLRPRRSRWIDGLHVVLDALLLSLLFTPASWLEPLRFLNGAIKLFRSHDWPGGTWWHGEFLSRVQDPQHWSTAGYLLRWLPSVTPLWILLLALFGIWHLGRLAFAGARVGGDAPLLPRHHQPDEAIVLFLPFLLQLLLLPVLAVIGNANLYDGVRHILFVYPPLALLAALGLDRLCRRFSIGTAGPRTRMALLVVAVMAALTLLDLLTLFPYAYVYVNEPMRFFLNPANTAFDYWGFAATDASRAAITSLSGDRALKHGCIASADLPDPVRAMLAPKLRASACGISPDLPLKSGATLLRLVSAQEADPQTCRSVSRWQWPWFRRTLSSACLEPVPHAAPPADPSP
ncbi:MAG: hypothetical protein ACKOZT_05480 [Cyanobium sp.]